MADEEYTGEERPAGWQCVLPFDTDDPEFVRGFEAGRLWEQLRLNDDEVRQTIHGTNVELAVRMSESTGRELELREFGDKRWTEVIFAANE